MLLLHAQRDRTGSTDQDILPHRAFAAAVAADEESRSVIVEKLSAMTLAARVRVPAESLTSNQGGTLRQTSLAVLRAVPCCLTQTGSALTRQRSSASGSTARAMLMMPFQPPPDEQNSRDSRND